MKLVHFCIAVILLVFLYASSISAECAPSPHSTALNAFALSPDGEWIAAAAADGTGLMWRVKTGTHTEFVHCISPAVPVSLTFSPDSSILALGSARGKIQIYQLPGSVLLGEFQGDMGHIEKIVFSADGSRLAAVHGGGASIWSVQSQRELLSIRDEGGVNNVALNRDGMLLARGRYQSIELIDVPSGTPLWETQLERGVLPTALAFASGDQWIISAQSNEENIIWDSKNGKVLFKLSGQTGQVDFPLVVSGTKSFFSMSDDGTLRLWDIEPAQLRSAWKTPPGLISGDAKFVLRPTSQPGRLELWRVGDPLEQAQSFTYVSPVCANDGDDSAKRRTNFDITARGEARSTEGAHLSFTTYAAQDCTTATLTSGDFSSAESAQRELQHMVKRASQVMEQSTNKNLLGQTLGERAVLSFAETGASSATSAVVWTAGSQYFQIISTSLRMALELEKRYKR